MVQDRYRPSRTQQGRPMHTPERDGMDQCLCGARLGEREGLSRARSHQQLPSLASGFWMSLATIP